ncbi:Hypothetical predicted protein [Pelobates cultripes]|uniref:Uncharacterized protein n=1 Tax=Pelobates cultripes TaxID=61616 RepID=A0AAD1VPV2_PELCU|nr:Hypothetical predicted protein [Pelobates cultripes]
MECTIHPVCVPVTSADIGDVTRKWNACRWNWNARWWIDSRQQLTDEIMSFDWGTFQGFRKLTMT